MLDPLYEAAQVVDVNEHVQAEWEKKQTELKERLLLNDADVVKEIIETIHHPEITGKEFFIGGVDISFIKGDNVNACAALVVVNFPDLDVVYEDYQMVKLTAPYIAGFLAFREVEFLVELVQKLQQNQPQYFPQVIMVDGNGRLHVRGFGLACHLGVLLDIPCVGVGKTLYQFDGLEKNEAHSAKVKELLMKGGDTFELIGESGITHGLAMRSHNSSTNPIYISQGHRISLQSCRDLVLACCQYRIPEPIRQADINSREYLRVHFPEATKSVTKETCRDTEDGLK